MYTIYKWHACPGSDKRSEEHKEEAQEEDTERKGGSRVAWPGCVAGVRQWYGRGVARM